MEDVSISINETCGSAASSAAAGKIGYLGRSKIASTGNINNFKASSWGKKLCCCNYFLCWALVISGVTISASLAVHLLFTTFFDSTYTYVMHMMQGDTYTVPWVDTLQQLTLHLHSHLPHHAYNANLAEQYRLLHSPCSL